MIQVVKRTFEILAILNEHGPLVLRDIATRAGLQKTTCHNILKSLADMDIVRCKRGGIYQIGDELRQLASLPVSNNTLKKVSSNYVERLAQITGETVILAVIRDQALQVLFAVEGAQEIVVRTTAHKNGSIYRWATGRVLLAHQTPANIARIIGDLGAPKQEDWPDVAGDLSLLNNELTQIRTLEILEKPAMSEGIASVACPIKKLDGRVVAALGISIPEYRMRHDNISNISRHLHQTALAVSQELSTVQ